MEYLRALTPADMPEVQENARRQNERDGTSYGVPRIFDAYGCLLPNVPMALAAVRNGRVRQAHIFERTLELMSFGMDRRATVASIREAPAVFFALAEMGYKDVHVQVPRLRVEQMEHGLTILMGLTRDDDRLAHFYRQFAGDKE